MTVINVLCSFTQTTCEGQERRETSEEMLVSVGCPAASSRMSWPMMTARADRRAQRWRLIASNEQHCSPHKTMNTGLPQKLQPINPLCPSSGSFFGTTSPCLKRREDFCAHRKMRGEIPAQLTQKKQPQHHAKHWSCHELPNSAGICINLPLQDSLL